MASMARSVLGLGAVAALTIGCSSGSTQHLDPTAIGMTADTPAFYDDNELTLFQVQLPVELPIARPSASDSDNLKGKIGPFDHHPWVTTSDVKIQVSWTLANLEQDTQNVEVLLDPWNEFGRYVPGVMVSDEEAQPNLSGIDEIYELPGLGDERGSRIRHTFSFDDMDEVATDFATAINIIDKVQPPPAMAGEEVDDPRIGLVNHVFERENQSGHSPLTDQYVPPVIPALLGFDIGFRGQPVGSGDDAHAPKLALEWTVEIVDKDGNKVVETGSTTAKLEAPDTTYSVGNE